MVCCTQKHSTPPHVETCGGSLVGGVPLAVPLGTATVTHYRLRGGNRFFWVSKNRPPSKEIPPFCHLRAQRAKFFENHPRKVEFSCQDCPRVLSHGSIFAPIDNGADPSILPFWGLEPVSPWHFLCVKLAEGRSAGQYMHVCMYMYAFVCIVMYLLVSGTICMYICIYMYICICMYKCIHTQICICM